MASNTLSGSSVVAARFAEALINSLLLFVVQLTGFWLLDIALTFAGHLVTAALFTFVTLARNIGIRQLMGGFTVKRNLWK